MSCKDAIQYGIQRIREFPQQKRQKRTALSQRDELFIGQMSVTLFTLQLGIVTHRKLLVEHPANELVSNQTLVFSSYVLYFLSG